MEDEEGSEEGSKGIGSEVTNGCPYCYGISIAFEGSPEIGWTSICKDCHREV